MIMQIRFVIPCLLGLEKLIADELKAFDAQDVVSENGRVLFSGDFNLLARANICCRYAERIQILVGTFPARSFEELFQGTKTVPWEAWIGKTDAFPVKGYSLNSTLFSVSDCQSIIKKAVVERLKSKYGLEWFDETGPVHQIQFSIMKDQVSLLFDTSGYGLHKSIVLCHDKTQKTIGAFRRAVPVLLEQGYQLVTVSELLNCSDEGFRVGAIYKKAD